MSATAIVTGGNRGIGLAITKSFVKAGYTVIVGARTEQNIQAMDPTQVIFRSIDVRDEMAHLTLAKTAMDATGRIEECGYLLDASNPMAN